MQNAKFTAEPAENLAQRAKSITNYKWAITNSLGSQFVNPCFKLTREDFNELRAIVAELASAQAKTEERVGSLERTVEALAEAQRRTEESVTELIRVQKDFATTFDMKIGAL